MVGTLRSRCSPGVSVGTRNMDARSYGGASGSVTAITIRTSAIMPFDVNHLCPLMTHSLPSSTAVVERFTGSEPAFIGSVMQEPQQVSAASGGALQRLILS